MWTPPDRDAVLPPPELPDRGPIDVVVLGIFVADATYRTPRLPVMGETLLGGDFALGPGGKGSNQAVAAAQAGAHTAILTRIGADTFGDMAVEVWDVADVVCPVPRVVQATGSACILVDDATGDNAIIVSAGAANGMDAAFVDAQTALIDRAKVFVTQLEQPMGAAHRALQIARDAGAVTVLNPAPAADLPDGMLALCDYLTPNETEAEALTGVAVTNEADARVAAGKLLEMGVARAVIVTLGAQGALYHSADESVLVPAISYGAVVETVGAGDAFNGAFAAALAEGQAPLEAARFGCVSASISVTRRGAAKSSPHREEIDAFLAR